MKARCLAPLLGGFGEDNIGCRHCMGMGFMPGTREACDSCDGAGYHPKTHYTCFGCAAADDCEFAYDFYNTDGDCLGQK